MSALLRLGTGSGGGTELLLAAIALTMALTSVVWLSLRVSWQMVCRWCTRDLVVKAIVPSLLLHNSLVVI